MEHRNTISILGSGVFGRAFVMRCVNRLPNTTVFVGSRDSHQTKSGRWKEALYRVNVVSIRESIDRSNIIIVAIPTAQLQSLKPFVSHLSGKILVDVSNTTMSKSSSNSSMLAELCPDSHVVKAFSTVSAEQLCSNNPEAIQVYISGDDEAAKETVSQLAKKMGFVGIDYGSLAQAGLLEIQPRSGFQRWRIPSIVLLGLALFWTIFTICRHFKLRKDPFSWERLPCNVLNKIFGAISLTNLACVFIPGCIARFIQHVKHQKNPDYPFILVTWLNIRQKLGLFSLLLCTIHMLLSVSMMSPAYYSKWFPKTYVDFEISPNNTVHLPMSLSSRMNWFGETCILLGVLAFLILVLLGISTLPSVSSRLTWQEWTWIHSHGGTICLLLAVCHVTLKGAAAWINKGFKDILVTVVCFSIILPWITVLMKFILYLPCLQWRLDRIKGGKEKTNLKHKNLDKKQRDSTHQKELSIIV